VKFAGAGYLAYLGFRTIRDSLRPAADVAVTATRARSRRAAFAQGFLSNVLNPKVALFYLTFLPQFISPGDNVLAKSLVLAAIHAVLGLAWLPLYAYAIDRVGAVVRGARRWLERLSGAALIGLGLRLALDRGRDDFIELALETDADEPAVIGRIRRTRGSRTIEEEHPVKRGASPDQLSEEDLLDFFASALEPWLER